MQPTPNDLIPMLIMLCRCTGNRINEIYNGKFQIEQKSDMTPVTCADIAAHCAIVSCLEMITPEIPVLSEEADETPFEERRHWQRYWLIDPVDGTREFINRTGEFTINIALIENNQPILGVIYAPVIGACYYASRNNGAYKLLTGQQAQAINVRYSDRQKLVVAAGRSGTTPEFEHYIKQLAEPQIITIGSSLKSCLIAAGEADIYPRFGPTSEWDTAAAQCILEEAGGRITDTNLQPLRYNTKESLLNPDFLAFGDVDHDWSCYLRCK
ncbi:3'(2'),5'-bisphosphate nucleotidase [hydrothermal vent metagenome]|uniref:3'-phosphoadenosine 5'-phosphate phosphatase n=1 Tax=hydrothermal vent metagenome TaxID=652676 RepID=A0A3B0ZS70_9ZZZZ